MTENILPQPPVIQPTPKSPKISLLFIVALIVVALVSGICVYFWRQINNQKLMDTQLVKTEQNQNHILPTPEPTPTDSRILLTPANIYNENTVNQGGMAGKACDQDFNQDAADTMVTYKNIDQGIEMSIPYNKNWGNKIYRINPYDEEKNGIKFGALSTSEGCSWVRKYHLTFDISKETSKKEIAASENFPVEYINEYRLNDIPVYVWINDGPGCWLSALFVGIKSNYKISFNGSCDQVKDLETIKMLSSLIKQIKNDQKTTLSADEWQKKFTQEFNKGVSCSKFFESRFSAKPNTTVTYSSNQFGYSIDLPYNPSWGDKENTVKPFETKNYDSNPSVWFGSPYSSEGCSFYRISLSELPADTIDNKIISLKADNQKIKSNPNYSQIFYTYEKVSNLKYPTLKVNTPNDLFGEVASYQVFLPKVTLEFSDPFGLDEKEFSTLVNSIKLF